MAIDVEHNGTHVLDESALCSLIDERDALRAEIERLKTEPEWTLGEAELVKDKIDRRIAAAVAQRTREIERLKTALGEIKVQCEVGIDCEFPSDEDNDVEGCLHIEECIGCSITEICNKALKGEKGRTASTVAQRTRECMEICSRHGYAKTASVEMASRWPEDCG